MPSHGHRLHRRALQLVWFTSRNHVYVTNYGKAFLEHLDFPSSSICGVARTSITNLFKHIVRQFTNKLLDNDDANIADVTEET